MLKDWVHGERRISWKWIIRDFAFRIIIYLFIPLLSLKLLSLEAESFGILLPTSRQLLQTIPLLLITFTLCLYFRGTSNKRIYLHPKRDFWFSLYLLFINSPSEELFYRGFLFFIITYLTGSNVLGLVFSSIFFGLQHFLFFGASSKNVLFDTFGGFFLGFCYVWLGKSLLPVIIIHGISNLALFTLGSYILQKLRIIEK